MSWVWESGPSDKAQLLVLLALADFCSDRGECWPSMKSVAEKARMSERNARRVVRDLESAGLLSTYEGGGRSGTSKYTINTDTVSPGQNVRPGQNDPETRTKRALNPDTAMSAEPSREPSREPSGKARAKSAAEILEAWASPGAVASFLAYRRKHKARAMTETGAKRLCEHLRKISLANGSADDALAMAEEKGWASVEPDWYFRAKGDRNDKPKQRLGAMFNAAAQRMDSGADSHASQPLLAIK